MIVTAITALDGIHLIDVALLDGIRAVGSRTRLRSDLASYADWNLTCAELSIHGSMETFQRLWSDPTNADLSRLYW